MDFVAAAEEVSAFVDLLTAHQQGGPGGKEREDEIFRHVILVRKIADALAPELSDGVNVRKSAGYWQWNDLRVAAVTLHGAIKSSGRASEILGPVGPSLAAARLHPWVWEAAARLWDDGHRRAAVQAAGTAVDTQLQAKLDRYDVSGTSLVLSAFSADPPAPGQPRLRYPEYPEGSPAWRDAHVGAMTFGQGCMMIIRNLATHDLDEPEEQVALERLAALSVLARVIEAATVVESEA